VNGSDEQKSKPPRADLVRSVLTTSSLHIFTACGHGGVSIFHRRWSGMRFVDAASHMATSRPRCRPPLRRPMGSALRKRRCCDSAGVALLGKTSIFGRQDETGLCLIELCQKAASRIGESPTQAFCAIAPPRISFSLLGPTFFFLRSAADASLGRCHLYRTPDADSHLTCVCNATHTSRRCRASRSRTLGLRRAL